MCENTGADAMPGHGYDARLQGPASLPDHRRFTFTLDVEDSDQMWDEPPDRYQEMGARYTKWITDPRRLMLNWQRGQVPHAQRPPVRH